MFIGERFVFLELEKTASTHIARLLARIVDGEQVGKHNRLTPELAASNRFILGAVRNPWDWYISLWSYSCATFGGLYDRQIRWSLTGYGMRTHPWVSLVSICHQFRRTSKMWRYLYSDVNNPELFRQWIVEMYNPQRKYDIANGYAQTPISDFSGYLTFMYMYLFAKNVKPLFQGRNMRKMQDLFLFDESNIRLDYVVHMENLEEDLIEALLQMEIPLSEDDKRFVRTRKPTNASERKRSLDDYYDARTVELVAEKERFFIEKFGYRKPDLAVEVGGQQG